MFSGWSVQTNMGTTPALVENSRFTHKVRVNCSAYEPGMQGYMTDVFFRRCDEWLEV